MILAWLRSFKRAPPAPHRWRLLVDGKELATLRDPQADETFWTAFEVLPSTSPPDAWITDDTFWLDRRWELVDAATSLPAPLAVASSAGLRDDGRRAVLRGLYAG